MCGNTDLLKNDGVFICQSCGTKYSVEEAKKMMVEGTVQVEDYTNRIIEIDTKHTSAWLIKGKTVGWQSSTTNVRFSESIECWSNALKNASEDKYEKMKKEVEKETLMLAKALINIRADNFRSNPSNENCNELCNFKTIFNPFILLITKADCSLRGSIINVTYCWYFAGLLKNLKVKISNKLFIGIIIVNFIYVEFFLYDFSLINLLLNILSLLYIPYFYRYYDIKNKK